MSVTQKPLPGADSKHFLAISYPLDWEKTHKANEINQLNQPDRVKLRVLDEWEGRVRGQRYEG